MQLALDLDVLPLNRQQWDLTEDQVEKLHEKFYIRNLQLLRDSETTSEQWQELVEWLDAPIVFDNQPFTFTTCCRVMGIEDPETNRELIKRALGWILPRLP